MGVLDASTSPPERYAVTETNGFQFAQPGTFADPLTKRFAAARERC